ncbi:MAG: sodium:solute symporter [Saprospiraceae bacterium]|nr:sodium:solute symporter [Saprospiraceae bacterium]
MESIQDVQFWQWLAIIGLGITLFVVSPFAKTQFDFFKASSSRQQEPGAFLLTSSLVMAWIFSKSITNAANLGLAYGFVGGVAYACYYLSFLVAGIVIYRMRTRGGYSSIHEFIRTKFGGRAVALFSVLIGFRLFNEVWSNTMVIGSYFGAQGSLPYYASILVFTGFTLAYVLKGGLKSSLLTDTIQMILFSVLLVVILGVLLPRENGDIARFVHSGQWQMGQGLNLLLVALIQVFSYPFHDPVLTDRGFISPPKTTLRSYALATVVGFLCILLFSFVGIYAGLHGMKGQAAVEVGRSLGVGMMLVMNLIMITSAASTLDSTFSSFSKLLIVDLGKLERVSISRGRLAMVLIAVLGTIPVLLGPEIWSATTVSGTMVLGLAPVFLCWRLEAPPLAFHLSVGAGMLIGLLFGLGLMPAGLVFSEGAYGDLFSVNVLGTALCFGLFFLAKWIKK